MVGTKIMKAVCIKCGERENYQDWVVCVVCVGRAIQEYLRPLQADTETEIKELIKALQETAPLATQSPWTMETIDAEFGGDYITGHITSPYHTYVGNNSIRARSDSIMSPDSMTRDDAEYIVLCQPANIIKLLAFIRDRCR